MAIVKAFAALRPRPTDARSICELPYDVMSAAEARRLAADNPLSFLRVTRPEIHFPEGTDPYRPEVYQRGREELERLVREGFLKRDDAPRFYVYQQTMGSHRQTGLVGLASCEEYREGIVRRHEFTRPDKETDRARHIEVLEAQTGPAFLVYRADAAIDALVTEVTARPAQIDFVASDGIRHEGWTGLEAATIGRLETAFAGLNRLYIADGHHRTAAAARVDSARGGRGGADHFLSVLFPHDQVRILPYHRLVLDLNGHTPAGLLERVKRVGRVERAGAEPAPCRHALGLYLAGAWHTVWLDEAMWRGATVAEGLDVALLQRHVLGPVFGIDDPRRSDRIDFVGGIHGWGELQRRVDAGQAACGWALFPTSTEELLAVADAGEIMPPKSTWFEPKLRDGMFTHVLGRDCSFPDGADGV
jgi:uncharacterized protein (DUF1015 family)